MNIQITLSWLKKFYYGRVIMLKFDNEHINMYS